VVFLLHLYVFTLVVLLIVYVFIQLNSWTNWSIFNWLAVITQLWILYYGYRSMRNLYQTAKWKGRLQYLTFLFSGMIVVILLFLGDILYTILSV
jgi:phosphoglycerol transferase MdoB-like AlkP superfamily enzyme